MIILRNKYFSDNDKLITAGSALAGTSLGAGLGIHKTNSFIKEAKKRRDKINKEFKKEDQKLSNQKKTITDSIKKDPNSKNKYKKALDQIRKEQSFNKKINSKYNKNIEKAISNNKMKGNVAKYGLGGLALGSGIGYTINKLKD